MTIDTQAAAEYRCPECDGALALVGGSWGCTACRYVPPHAAD
jgi:ribosomal protein L37AE/L43A